VCVCVCVRACVHACVCFIVTFLLTVTMKLAPVLDNSCVHFRPGNVYVN